MKKLLLVLLLFPLFCIGVHAEASADRTFELFDPAQMQSGLSDEEREIGGAISVDGYDVSAALKRLWRSFAAKLKAQLHEELGFASKLLVLVFLSAFACSVCPEEKTRGMIEICAVCLAAVLLTGGMSSLVTETSDAVFRLSDYSRAALPAVYTAAAASGGVSSAAVSYAQAALALDVMMSISRKAVIPMIYATLSLTLADVVFPNPMLAAVAKLTKWAAKTALTWTTLAFTALLGMSSLITTRMDAAAIKATRTVMSSALPVVGGMLSDASSAVLAAGSVVAGCMGAFGLVAVCAVCAGPFAVLSVKGLLFKAVAAVAESTQSPQLQRLFAGIDGAVGLLMGLLGANAVMLFLSFAAAMKVVA